MEQIMKSPLVCLYRALRKYNASVAPKILWAVYSTWLFLELKGIFSSGSHCFLRLYFRPLFLSDVQSRFGI